MSVAVRGKAAEMLSQLSNPTRLLVLAELVRRGDGGATLSELATALELPVAKLGDACSRLLSLDAAGRTGDGRYVARLAGLREISQSLDETQPISVWLAEYPKLRGLFSHGRLIALPVLYGDPYWQLAEVLARFVALDGPVDEPEINRRLSAVTDDVAKIRRMLVDTGWFERDRAGTTYRPSRPVGR
jgi:DNA-binding transcriptional ArsR family regulator